MNFKIAIIVIFLMSSFVKAGETEPQGIKRNRSGYFIASCVQRFLGFRNYLVEAQRLGLNGKDRGSRVILDEMILWKRSVSPDSFGDLSEFKEELERFAPWTWKGWFDSNSPSYESAEISLRFSLLKARLLMASHLGQKNYLEIKINSPSQIGQMARKFAGWVSYLSADEILNLDWETFRHPLTRDRFIRIYFSNSSDLDNLLLLLVAEPVEDFISKIMNSLLSLDNSFIFLFDDKRVEVDVFK